jgi:hypothetical protein
MKFAAGQRLTIFRISEWSAMTNKQEIEIRSVLDPTPVGYQKCETRFATFRPRGKRKEYYLDLPSNVLVFPGWDLPFVTDMEAGNVFSGNACFNLVGDPEVIRDWVENKAILPVSDSTKASILVWPQTRKQCGDAEAILLYAEIETHHAVVNGMKERARA